MPAIPDHDTINRQIESLLYPVEHRGYLGLSQIGHECSRYLYYVLHDAYREKVSARTMRIWERGHWEEPRVIRDLKKVGCAITDEQKEISLFGGHIKGHIDGIVTNVPGSSQTHLFECKAIAETYWKKLKSSSLEIIYPMYWGQIQTYMHYLNLKRTLFVACNKNTEERFYHRYHYNKKEAEALVAKMLVILTADCPPDKIGGPDWYKCKICSMYSYCHLGGKTNICCRSCKHCEFGNDKLICAKGHDLTVKDTVLLGCVENDWESCV